ncbi:MAG: PKD domain-containing protein [Bacteroidota bacterium]
MQEKLNRKIKLLLAILLPACYFSASAQTKPASVCDNLDFRRGNFTNWVGRTTVYPANWADANNCNPANNTFTVCPNQSGNSCNGCYSYNGNLTPQPSGALGPIPFYNNTGIVNGRHTIMNAATPDPYSCNNIMRLPPGEPFCARLGNGGQGAWGNGVGWQIDYLSYTYKVDNTNSLLTYKYAVIFQDPVRDPLQTPHTPGIRPRFVVKVMDANGTLIDPSCGKFDVVYDTTIAGFRECSLQNIQSMGGNPYALVGTAYRAWTTVGVDLRGFVGQNITLEFNTWDCGWGGHFGYAYVSARCDAFNLTSQTCTTDGSVLVSAPEGFSYQWFPSLETTKDIKIFNANPGDSVYVEMTSVSGCKTTVGTRIYPTVASAKFKINPTTVCVDNPVTFSDSSSSHYTGNNSSVPIVNWDWRFGDGNTSTVQHPVHTYTTPGTFTVNLTITNQNGCTDSIKKSVIVLPAPQANFVMNDICVNGTAEFSNASTVMQPQAITNWTWTFKDDNSTSNLPNSTHQYNTPGTYTVNLLVKTDQGCVHDTSRTIKIWPLPKANFTAKEVCIGDTTFFFDKSLKSDPADNIVNWIWDFGDNSALSSDKDPGHVYLSTGTYQVQLIVGTNKGCVKDTTISIVVHPSPIANFVATPLCKGTPVTFKDLSTPSNIIVSWQWNFGDITNNISTQQDPTHTYDSSRVYYPELFITSQYGCSDSIIIPINITPLPEVGFDANRYEGCAPLCIDFKDLSYSGSDPIIKWSWTFGDGNGATIKSPSHCYVNPGIYTVALAVETANTCKQSKTWVDMIKAYPTPIADFEANPYETGESAPLIKFFDKSSGADFWRWDFGDNEGALVQDTSHTYKKSGTFTVWLHIKNQYGCIDSIAKDIVINPEWTFYVPNAFTPGVSSGINDGFRAFGTNIKEFEMWIFDRWGNNIFNSNDINESWNGAVHNGIHGEKTAQQDVYVWKITIRDLFGEQHRYIGIVTLVR